MEKTRKNEKNETDFHCKICNFKCSYECDYTRHLLTAKHKNRTVRTEKSEKREKRKKTKETNLHVSVVKIYSA